MVRNKDLFFRLLRVGLETEKADGRNPVGFFVCDGEVEDVKGKWREIYRLGVAQGVGVIVFDGLQKLVKDGCVPAGLMPPREIKGKWMADTMRLEKVCGMQYQLSSALAGLYAEHGIRTVVMKGIAAGLNYPQPDHRPCGDLDCFLMGDYERGNVIAESAGAKVKRGFYKHSHIKYKGLEVENHQFCTAVRGSRRWKAFERLLHGLLCKDGTEKIGDTSLECPPPLFDALFLTYHSQRHYLSEGIALRHLCDWAMLLKVHGSNVDWTRFREVAGEYGLDAFADSMTRLSAAYLGVPVPGGYDVTGNEKLDSMLMDDILNYSKIYDGMSEWRARISLVKGVMANRRRYRYFSDTSMLSDLARLIYGFCFDRNPVL